MSLDGIKPAKLGSVQDRIRTTVYYRKEQRSIFETLINVYAAMISISPEVAKKVEIVIDDYIELIVPGSREHKRLSEANTLQKNSDALKAIYKSLESTQSGKGNPFL